jgi:hypothetical protein
MPVGWHAISTGILTHGREKNAIFELNIPEPETRKQYAHT